MAKSREYMDYLDEAIEIAPANSQEEYQAAETIAEIMRGHGLEPTISEFDAYPLGKLIPSVLTLVLFVCLLVTGLTEGAVHLITLLLGAACAAGLLLSHYMRNFFETFGPAQRSQNVVAVHRAEGDKVVKGARPIVIVAHYDTPRESFMYRGALARYRATLLTLSIPCTVAVAIALFIQLLAFLPAVVRIFIWVVGLITALPLVYLAIAQIAESRASCTEGANNNKASVAAMLGILDKVRPAADEGIAEDGAADARRPRRKRAVDIEAEREEVAKPRRVEVVEEVKGVRHGAEVLAALGILPPSCEVVYEEPKVRVIEEAVEPQEADEAVEAGFDDADYNGEESKTYAEDRELDGSDARTDGDDYDEEDYDKEFEEDYDEIFPDDEPDAALVAPEEADNTESSEAPEAYEEDEFEEDEDFDADEGYDDYDDDYDEDDYDEDDYDEDDYDEDDYEDEDDESTSGVGSWFKDRFAAIRGLFSKERDEDADMELEEDENLYDVDDDLDENLDSEFEDDFEDDEETFEELEDYGEPESYEDDSYEDTSDDERPEEDELFEDMDADETADEDLPENDEIFEEDDIFEGEELFEGEEYEDDEGWLYEYDLEEDEVEDTETADTDAATTDDAETPADDLTEASSVEDSLVFDEEYEELSDDGDVVPSEDAVVYVDETPAGADEAEETAGDLEEYEGAVEEEDVWEDVTEDDDEPAASEELVYEDEEYEDDGDEFEHEWFDDVYDLENDAEEDDAPYEEDEEDLEPYEEPERLTFGDRLRNMFGRLRGRHDEYEEAEAYVEDAVDEDDGQPEDDSVVLDESEPYDDEEVQYIDVIQYVDEDGNVIEEVVEYADGEEGDFEGDYEEEIIYVDEDGNEIDYVPDQANTDELIENEEPETPTPPLPAFQITPPTYDNPYEAYADDEPAPYDVSDDEEYEEYVGEDYVDDDDVYEGEDIEDEDSYVAYEDEEFEDAEYEDAEDEAYEDAEEDAVTVQDDRPIDPNLLHFDRVEDDDIVPRDITGLDELADSYDMYGSGEIDRIPQREMPEPIDDPDWGVSSYRPPRPTINIARRAALFDLPDPSGRSIDPLAQEDEDYDDTPYEDEGYGMPETHAEDDVQGEESQNGSTRKNHGGFWGGATVRADLREDGDEPIVIDEDDLQEAILEMGDDFLVAHDIWFVATGASEVNHAGIKAFLDEHRRDIRGAFLVNLEGVGAGDLSVYVKEGLHTPRRADRRLVRMLSTIGSDLHIKLRNVTCDWDETEAASAMRQRVRAVTLAGLDENDVPAYAHTADDVPENVDPRQVDSVVRLVCELIRRA